MVIIAAHLSEVLTVLLFLETKYYSLEVSLRSCHPRLAEFLFFLKKRAQPSPGVYICGKEMLKSGGEQGEKFCTDVR